MRYKTETKTETETKTNQENENLISKIFLLRFNGTLDSKLIYRFLLANKMFGEKIKRT